MKLNYFLVSLLIISCGKKSSDEQKSALAQNSSQLEADKPEAAETPAPEATSAEKPSENPQESDLKAQDPNSNNYAIDASSTETSVYLDLSAEGVTVSNPEGPWDIAVKRTMWQTNSGTSGEAGVGVFNPGTTDFASLTSCEYDNLSYDEMLPVPGPPDSGTFSGNPILNDWYNYDPVTHAVSSKEEVYLISDGSECLKLQILSYADGVYEVKAASLSSACGQELADGGMTTMSSRHSGF
jgi:hypothetical protein